MKGGLIGFHKCWLIVWLYVISQSETGVLIVGADCIPSTGCNALAYYRVKTGDTADLLFNRFQVNGEQLQSYNRNVTNLNSILAGTSLFLPFDCTCINGRLIHMFPYTVSEDFVEYLCFLFLFIFFM